MVLGGGVGAFVRNGYAGFAALGDFEKGTVRVSLDAKSDDDAGDGDARGTVETL